MNALSRAGSRTKFFGCLFAAVVIVAIATTAYSALVAEPNLEISFSQYETNQNGVAAIILVKNTGTAPAIFRGYGGSIPALESAQRDATGLWQPRIRYCGVGLTYFCILPGQEIRCAELMYHTSPWRSGISYRKASFYDRLPAKLQRHAYFLAGASHQWITEWSSEITPPPRDTLFAIGFVPAFE